jgi:hypothetical protein
VSGRLAFPEFVPGSVWRVGAGPGDPGPRAARQITPARVIDGALHRATGARGG